MGRFSIRSIILGIGIGLIVASLVNMIYLAGERPKNELSDQEIINRALDLGMVPASTVIDRDDKDNPAADKSKTTDNKSTKTTSENTKATGSTNSTKSTDSTKSTKGSNSTNNTGSTGNTVSTNSSSSTNSANSANSTNNINSIFNANSEK